MSRISKELSKDIAKKLLEKNLEIMKKKRSKFEEAVTKVYKKSIPKEVVDISKRGKDYIQYSSMLSVDYSLGWSSVRMTEELPRQNGHRSFTPKGSDKERLVRLYDEWNNEKIDCKKTYEEVKNAIYSLKTYSRIAKE